MATELPPGAASLLLPPDAEGVPVIDLTGTLANLGQDALRFRAWAARDRALAAELLVRAGQFAAAADRLALLRDSLTGAPRGD